MTVGWHSSAGVLRRSSGSLGKLSECRRGAGSGFKYVPIPEKQEAMLSSLCGDAKFSLLATHLLSVCRVQGSAQVSYGRLGRVRAIIINGVEYQEQGGRVQEYKLG